MGIDLSRGQRSAPMTELAVVISIACRRLQWPAHHECVHSAVTNGGGKRRALAVVLSLRVVHGTSLGISRRLLVGYYSTTMKCRSICDVECRAQGSHACMLPQVATRVVHAHTHTCMDATMHSDTALMAQRHAAQHAPASSRIQMYTATCLRLHQRFRYGSLAQSYPQTWEESCTCTHYGS